MTQSIDLDQLAIDTTRRDQWGRYLVVPPTGGNPVGYTRVTTVAKTLDSGGGLAPWKAAMTAQGIIMRKGLRAQWEALLAEYGDPWYSSPEAKKAAKKLVEECAAAGGANERREVGSAFHAITAMLDSGRPPEHLTDETKRDLDAYASGMGLVGAEVDPHYLEKVVVLDDLRVAGTFDRLVTLPNFPLPLIADLKTGADLSYSWQSIAVQLAAYSRADCIYVQGASTTGSEDQRLPMPEVDQRFGLIMHLDAGSGELRLYIVDLVAGWEAFMQSMVVREWRNRRDLAIPLAEFDTEKAFGHDTLTAQLEASLSAHGIGVAERLTTDNVVPLRPVDPAGVDMAAVQEAVADGQAVRAWLQQRIDKIGAHEGARGMLRDHWPADVPTLKSSDSHTEEQLLIIERLLDGVERAHDLGFPTAKPGT